MSEITISCLCGKTLRATSEEPSAYCCDDCQMGVLIADGEIERGPHLKLVRGDANNHSESE